MNKKIKLILLLAIVSPSVWAVSVKPTDSSKFDSLPKTAPSKEIKVDPIQTMKSGRLNLVDLSSNLIIVNNERYTLTKDVQIYDGKLESKKFVRFLLSPEKQVTEIWVHK